MHIQLNVAVFICSLGYEVSALSSEVVSGERLMHLHNLSNPFSYSSFWELVITQEYGDGIVSSPVRDLKGRQLV